MATLSTLPLVAFSISARCALTGSAFSKDRRRCRRGVCAVTIPEAYGAPASWSRRALAESEGRKAQSVLTSWRSFAKPACSAPPQAARPGSSEVEQPPCKRPVGGSNPFPGSRSEVSAVPFRSVEMSVAFATIFGRSAQSAAGAWPGVCPSGQREQTVNLPASPTEVRILPPPRTEYAPVAQLVEHFHGKEGVSGSSPLGGSGDQGFEVSDPRECGGVAQLVRAAES